MKWSNPFSKFETKDCPNGQEPVRLPKKTADAAKLFLATRSQQKNLSVGVPLYGKGAASLEETEKFEGSLVNINTYSGTLQLKFNQNFETFRIKACEKYEWFIKRVDAPERRS